MSSKTALISLTILTQISAYFSTLVVMKVHSGMEVQLRYFQFITSHTKWIQVVKVRASSVSGWRNGSRYGG